MVACLRIGLHNRISCRTFLQQMAALHMILVGPGVGAFRLLSAGKRRHQDPLHNCLCSSAPQSGNRSRSPYSGWFSRGLLPVPQGCQRDLTRRDHFQAPM